MVLAVLQDCQQVSRHVCANVLAIISLLSLLLSPYRYESTIVNQFFGHSHTDHFEVFFDLENKTRATK